MAKKIFTKKEKVENVKLLEYNNNTDVFLTTIGELEAKVRFSDETINELNEKIKEVLETNIKLQEIIDEQKQIIDDLNDKSPIATVVPQQPINTYLRDRKNIPIRFKPQTNTNIMYYDNIVGNNS